MAESFISPTFIMLSEGGRDCKFFMNRFLLENDSGEMSKSRAEGAGLKIFFSKLYFNNMSSYSIFQH